MCTLREAFLYIRPLWENRQHEISLRGVLAIFLTINFMCNIGSISDGALQIEALLIASLLGLTMFQNIQDKKTEADVEKTVIKSKGKDGTDDPDIQVNTVNIKK